MEEYVMFCPTCAQKLRHLSNPYGFTYKGFCYLYGTPKSHTCEACGAALESTNITRNDFHVLWKISDDNDFLLAMIKLKEDDIVEYNLRLSQFKTQIEQQAKKEESANLPKCPTCGSTNIEKISVAQKAAGGFLFGLFSSNVRKTMKCNNCGYKW